MLRALLKHGAIAGIVVGAFMFATFLGFGREPPSDDALLIGYATMQIALSAVFAGIKRHRDVNRGGVIGFWPALGVGQASASWPACGVAWEGLQALMHRDFATGLCQRTGRTGPRTRRRRRGTRAHARRDGRLEGAVRQPAVPSADDRRRDLSGRRAGVAGVGGAAQLAVPGGAACLTPDSGVRSVDIDLAFPPRLPAHPGLTLAEV
jgi:hypothetical protein